jgi:dienelactone hydrolase
MKDISTRFKVPTSLEEWTERIPMIEAALLDVMGTFPGDEKRCELDVIVSDDVDCGSYLRREISYASEPQDRTPAYLLVPKTARPSQPAPGVLCLHPTNDVDGYKTVVGLSEMENRNYAEELAERGYVTLAPAYPMLANYYPDVYGLGYTSCTMKGIWNHSRGLDVLDGLPEVRSGSYVAIGHSLGGHNSVFTALFDERIRAVISSCGLDSYRDYMDGDLTGWCGERYMPKLSQCDWEHPPFDFYDLVAKLAPRPCFISAPLADSNFNWQSVDSIVDAARQVYALYGADEWPQVEHPNCGHDFPESQRLQAYTVIDGVSK